MTQATHILADVLQDRGPLRIFFVHYIAQWVVCAVYCPACDALCVPRPSLARLSRHDHPECSLAFRRFQQSRMHSGVHHHDLGRHLFAGAARHDGQRADVFVGLRFAAAVTLAVGFFSLRTLRGLTLFELKAGVIGVAIMFGYGLQTIEAQTILSSQSAFITALYVPFVPLLQWLVLGRRPGLMPSIGIMLAFAGLMLLTGPAGASLNFSPGEIATLIGAVAIAAGSS